MESPEDTVDHPRPAEGMMSLSDHQWTAALLGLILLSAGIVLFRAPSSAGNLESVPDSVEYATAAIRFVTHGTCDITINSSSYPSRYPPWFSMLILAPAYKLFGPEPGNGILPIFLFGLAGVGAAFFLGKHLSGYAGGVLAALFVVLLPDYRLDAKFVLTDLPATALVLILCLLFVRLRSSESSSPPRGTVILAALLTSLAAALRPATAAIVLPFLLWATTQSGRRRIYLGALFLLPLLALVVLQLIYNASVFGNPFRNGYKFWCPVPYDYFHLTFSTTYIPSNLVMLLESGVVYLLVVMGVLLLFTRRTSPPPAPLSDRSFRSLGWLALAGLGPLVVFHLVYFYPDDRFFLPLAALLAVTTGALSGRFLARLPVRTLMLMQMGLLILAFAFRCGQKPDPSIRKWMAEEIRRCTPTNAIIITGIDAAYLGTMFGESSQRFVVPTSRQVEYASKQVCYQRVEVLTPPPRGWWDHRCPGLARGGAVDVIPVTADENSDWITQAIREGKPVFAVAIASAKDKPIIQSLGKKYVSTSVAPWLFRLSLPPEPKEPD